MKALDKFQIATIRKKTINAKYLVILAKYFDTMQQLIQLIEKEKLGNRPATQHTLIIDDKQVIHGALFLVKTARKTFKLMIPAPFHEAVLKEQVTINALIKHPQVMLLA
ncbi:hypothetical protein A9970_02375 [Sphingobacterium sp. UME9]|nr:hypothetical protein [Sphingobacterium sp. UME9]